MASLPPLTTTSLKALRPYLAEVAEPLDVPVPAAVSQKALGPLFLSMAEAGRKLATPAEPAPIGNPEWARVEGAFEGFNPKWYAHIRPDVVAAGADLLDHYRRYGRDEGSLPYENATPWKPKSLHDAIYWGVPQIDFQDHYVEAGASEVILTGRINRRGEPIERSFMLRLYARNENGAGINTVGRQPDVPMAVVFPNDDGVFRQRMALDPNWRGFFVIEIQGQDSHQPGASARIYCGVTPPADYARRVYAQPKARPAVPKPSKWALDTKLLDDLWDVARPMGSDLNHMRGAAVAPGDRALNGALVDPYPIIDGDRGFRPVDCRGNPFRARSGRMSEWGMPGIIIPSRSIYGVWQVVVYMPAQLWGINFGGWGIKSDGSWPPEWDHWERIGHRTTANFHGYDNTQQGFELPQDVGWFTITWERTATTYRQWWQPAGKDAFLTVECPNYLEATPMDTTLSIEGPGGDAAPGDDVNRDYSGFVPRFRGFRQAVY